MAEGPLDDPRLCAVEGCLDERRFDEAQRMLAELGAVRDLGPGVAYLTARLLYQRGRLDRAALVQRLQDVLAECAVFPQARELLERAERGELQPQPARAHPPHGAPASAGFATSPALVAPNVSEARSDGSSAAHGSSRLETPRVPPPPAPPGAVSVPSAPEVAAPTAPSPPPVPTLEPPRSELPTDPAPPPSAAEAELARGLELHEPAPKPQRFFPPLEVDLASGRSQAAFAALEKLALERLDGLLARGVPKLDEVAWDAADFLTLSPATSHFAPYDLSLDSLERLDAVLALFTQHAPEGSCYALSVLLSAYVGECVRAAGGGNWQGRLVEPDRAQVQRRSGEAYLPWLRVQHALKHGLPLRADAGPRPHPAAEPVELPERDPVVAKTYWEPQPWPALDLVVELGRAVPSSVLGAYATRAVRTPLDRSLGSLVAIDRYIALLAPRGVVSGVPLWARRPAVLAGAYVGEVLCFHAAGRWSENAAAPSGPLRFQVLLPDGKAAYPVLWAYDALKGQGKAPLSERARSAGR